MFTSIPAVIEAMKGWNAIGVNVVILVATTYRIPATSVTTAIVKDANAARGLLGRGIEIAKANPSRIIDAVYALER